MSTLKVPHFERSRKKLAYAYATSPDAKRFNRNKGCWLVWADQHPKTQPVVFQDGEHWLALGLFQRIKAEFSNYDSFSIRAFRPTTDSCAIMSTTF